MDGFYKVLLKFGEYMFVCFDVIFIILYRGSQGRKSYKSYNLNNREWTDNSPTFPYEPHLFRMGQGLWSLVMTSQVAGVLKTEKYGT